MHYEMAKASKKAAISQSQTLGLEIAFDNIDFTPPTDGGTYLKFSYMEAASTSQSLDRECRLFLGLVQIDVIFKPGTGTDSARNYAQSLAEYFAEGLSIDAENGIYVSEWAEINSVQKSEDGWFFPVRFTVRCEKRMTSAY